MSVADAVSTDCVEDAPRVSNAFDPPDDALITAPCAIVNAPVTVYVFVDASVNVFDAFTVRLRVVKPFPAKLVDAPFATMVADVAVKVPLTVIVPVTVIVFDAADID